MSRHESYMKAMSKQEELRMAQANKQSDNVKAWPDVGSPEDYPPSADMVNSPPHYNQTGIECIHAISAATGDGYKYFIILPCR